MSDTPVCHRVEFRPSGRGKAQCDPNPDYPNGILINAAKPGEETCTVGLPYPAAECGAWMIHCETCKITIAVTAAGRPDDPFGVIIPCQRLQIERPAPPSIGSKLKQ